MKLKEKLKNAIKIIKEAYSAVAVGFITVILGIGLSFVGRRKNVSDNGNPEDRARDDIEKLRGVANNIGSAEERLRKNNYRLAKLLEEFEEEEPED